MCTLVAKIGRAGDSPLVVAANRDEKLDRPSSPPRRWPGTSARFVAPVDELAGGTWLGLNEHDVFVAITNRAGAPPDPKRRSRGALVVDALGARSAAALHASLETLNPAAYNPFHLLYADRSSAHLTWADGRDLYRVDLAPGLHVVTERSSGTTGGGPLVEREAWIRDAWPPTEDVASLARLLAYHGPTPFDGTCIHADAFGYGTRSSAIVVLGHDGTRELHWAEGKPCTTRFVRYAEPDAIRS